jgi:hypothetical protein
VDRSGQRVKVTMTTGSQAKMESSTAQESSSHTVREFPMYGQPVDQNQAGGSVILKVQVWKEMNQHQFFRMWRGHCSACNKYTQFWFFGATLGYMLEHIRRCEPFRYAAILANGPVRPVSSPLPPADMSGQTREPEGTTPPVVPSVSSGWPEAPVFGFRERT